MTIPFLNLFKRKTAAPAPVAPTPSLPPIEKPSSERLSKTVLPSAARAAAAKDPFAPLGQPSPPSAAIAFSPNGGSNGNRAGNLPPAVALALEPAVERVISLELFEVASQMPSGWIRPVSDTEASRRVLLKAAEIEKGMASGKPSVSVVSIYRQVPEIFVRPVLDSDETQVPLPFEKVMEQFTKLQLRQDQYRDQAVPQVETPFLKVTLEDNTKFGITMEPVQTGELPPVRLEPATAQAIAAAEPEAAFREKFIAPLPMMAATTNSSTATATVVAPPEKPASAAPTRIPFKLSPTGPDAPATERVPASSGGPSVPTSTESGPKRIPFKLKQPSEEDAPDKEPWLTRENFEKESAAGVQLTPFSLGGTKSKPAPTGTRISLPLKPVLQALPPFQLIGDINGVPDDARFELAFSLVEPQLPSGRVSVKPDEFAAALPEAYKGFFCSKEIAAPVAIPLQDLLKNLPTASLRMREDQEEQEKGVDFVTPFSAKAEEDAKRFNPGTPTEMKPLKGMVSKAKPLTVTAAPVEKLPELPNDSSARTPIPFSIKLPTAPTPIPQPALPKAPEPKPVRNALQIALDTDEEVDAKAAVARVEKMAGVKACALIFGDGLSLAGNLPEHYQADGLCAMAPSLLQRTENHLTETKLGALNALTLSCSKAAVTFFMHDNLCLAALHANGELAPDVRERLGSAVQELSKKYSHPV